MLFYAVLNLVPFPTFAPCRSSSMCMLFRAPYFPDTQSINYNALRMKILPAYTTSGCLSIHIYIHVYMLYVDGRGSMRLAFGVKAVAHAAFAAIVRCDRLSVSVVVSSLGSRRFRLVLWR